MSETIRHGVVVGVRLGHGGNPGSLHLRKICEMDRSTAICTGAKSSVHMDGGHMASHP